ncbi:MAG: hypothetical protein GY820_29970, partial [Gammaproteobacteria bacterium]|nr:hypothetical protein [Gammaproteobacteria bacterium]
KRKGKRKQKAKSASSTAALDEQEEDDDSEEAPIPITAEEVMQLGLNINPQQRSHLVSHSFIKKQVQLLMESERLRQYRNLTEQERKRVQDQLDTLHGEMTTLIELQQRREKREKKKRERRKQRKREDPDAPSPSSSSSSEEDEEEESDKGEGEGDEDRKSGSDDEEGTGEEEEEEEKEGGEKKGNEEGDKGTEEKMDHSGQEQPEGKDEQQGADQSGDQAPQFQTQGVSVIGRFEQHQAMLDQHYTGAAADQAARAAVITQVARDTETQEQMDAYILTMTKEGAQEYARQVRERTTNPAIVGRGGGTIASGFWTD